SIAVRAQWLGILPKHSFPRQLFSHWLISCQILALVGLLFATRAAYGQDPRPTTTLSVDVKVVTLPVTVREKRGQIVRNLAKDQAFIIHFDREVELLQDLTSARDKLQTALASLQTPRPERDSGGGGESSPDSSSGRSQRMHGGGTLLYDAVFLASDELMKKQ